MQADRFRPERMLDGKFEALPVSRLCPFDFPFTEVLNSDAVVM